MKALLIAGIVVAVVAVVVFILVKALNKFVESLNFEYEEDTDCYYCGDGRE